MALAPLTVALVLVLLILALEIELVVSMVQRSIELRGDFDRVLLIDRKNDKFCRLICLFDPPLFSYGTCRRSRISPCTSWRFYDNQAQLASC